MFTQPPRETQAGEHEVIIPGRVWGGGVGFQITGALTECILTVFCRSLQSNVRSVSSMHVLDSPGFQNPASLGRTSGASFEDLCHNYECERLQKFFHHTVFTAQMERYSQVQCSTCCLVCTHVATSPTNQGPDSTPWNKCFFVGRFIN